VTEKNARREHDDAGAADPQGLECPSCGCRHLPVIYTRRTSKRRIMRRRECRYCGKRITTYERSIG